MGNKMPLTAKNPVLQIAYDWLNKNAPQSQIEKASRQQREDKYGVFTLEPYPYIQNKTQYLRSEYVERFGWAIPSDYALQRIADFAPIIEMGAGRGFWAACLEAERVNIVSYDIDPPVNAWVDIKEGTPEILADYPHRSLLMVWPPYETHPGAAMSYEALENYKGEHVLYIGESKLGCTGTDEFHDRLEEEFDEIEWVKIPLWYGLNDSLFIYRRK